MAKRITIAGYYGFGNVGDEAILHSMLADLRREYPGARFRLLCSQYARTAEAEDLEKVLWTDWRSVIESVRKCDVLIVGGGGLFASYLGYAADRLLVGSQHFSSFIFGLPVLAWLMGKPCCLYGVGASHLDSAEARHHVKLAVKLATTCTVRDAASLAILAAGDPSSAAKLRLTADPAFRLENAPLRQLPFSADRPVIAVVVRNWDFFLDGRPWELELAGALEEFARVRGWLLLFVPFQSAQDVPRDLSNDHSAIERVRSRLGSDVASLVLTESLTAPEISAVLAACQMVVGMRLHASILAVKNAVPFVALGYDPKVRNVLARCGLESFVIDLNGLQKETLIEAMHPVCQERTQIGRRLQDTARVMSRAAYGNVHAVAEALAERARPGAADAEIEAFLRGLALKQTLLLAELQQQAQGTEGELSAHRQALRRLLADLEFEPALRHLETLLSAQPGHPEWTYLKGYCLHCLRRDLPQAEQLYCAAAAGGFDEFWVRYHLGLLRMELGKRQEGIADLVRARALNPEHKDLQDYLRQAGIGNGSREPD